jgi:hypothetical protein
VAHWELVREPVRAHLARRILVSGDDDSLRAALALVETVRARGGSHRLTQLVASPDQEDAAARTGGPILVCVVGGDDPRPRDLPDVGTVEERLAAGLALVGELLAEGWGLAEPVVPDTST